MIQMEERNEKEGREIGGMVGGKEREGLKERSEGRMDRKIHTGGEEWR